jgi:hypothetical protein
MLTKFINVDNPIICSLPGTVDFIQLSFKEVKESQDSQSFVESQNSIAHFSASKPQMITLHHVSPLFSYLQFTTDDLPAFLATSRKKLNCQEVNRGPVMGLIVAGRKATSIRKQF